MDYRFAVLWECLFEAEILQNFKQNITKSGHRNFEKF